MSAATGIKALGATPHEQGVVFRVWAPHATQVSVIGSFNDWDGGKHPMQAEEDGYWFTNVAEAHALGLKVLPWTVNAPGDMAMLIDLKVDGLITDYPDRGLAVVADKGLKPR